LQKKFNNLNKKNAEITLFKQRKFSILEDATEIGRFCHFVSDFISGWTGRGREAYRCGNICLIE
jgi:hypothetical protein